MKNTISKMALITLFLGSAFILKAQDDMEAGSETETNDVAIINDNATENPRMFEHQFGFNATQLVQSLFGSGFGGATSPFSVNYKLLYNCKPQCGINSIGLRAGMGQVNVKDEVTVSSSSFFNSNSFKQTSLRIGIEVQKKIHKNWVVFGGIDYVSFNNNQESKTVFNNPPNNNVNIFTQTDKNNGFGPILGIQVNISKHIVMNTELSYYFLTGNTTSTQESFSTGFYNKQTQERKTNFSTITVPAFVNFNISF